MSGQALSSAQTQLTTLTGFAQSAIATANAAISALSNVDIPIPSQTTITVAPPVPFDPSTPAPPSSLTLPASPTLSALTVPPLPVTKTLLTVTDATTKDIVLPDIPELLTYDLPEQLEPLNLGDPENWGFADYQSYLQELKTDLETDDLISTIKDKLNSNITTGGTGLSADVEAAIWDRDSERFAQQLEDSQNKITTEWAKKGFSLPDGFLAHSMMELSKEHMNRSLDRSRDISIKQAELEQANIFKSMEMGVNLSFKMIDFMINLANFVLQGETAVAKFANEYIDLQIKTYMSLVEAYKAELSLYEMKIRTNNDQINIYKEQINAQKLIGDVNQQAIQLYSEQIKANTLLVDQYKAEVDAANAVLGFEKQKIESNKILIDAWATDAQTQIEKFKGEIEKFKTEGQQNISVAELKTRSNVLIAEAAFKNAELFLKAFEVTETANQTMAQTKMEGAKATAIAAQGLAAGAMAAAHASASFSYTENMALTEP